MAAKRVRCVIPTLNEFTFNLRSNYNENIFVTLQ